MSSGCVLLSVGYTAMITIKSRALLTSRTSLLSNIIVDTGLKHDFII